MEKVMCPYCNCEDTVLAEETEEGFDFDKRNSLSGWKRIPEVRLKNALPE